MSHTRLLGLLVGTVLISGCGGGSSTPSPSPTPTPGSDRPGVAGISASFTGSLSEVITNNAIAATPVTSTTNATVTAALTSAKDASGNTLFTVQENDAGALSTTSTTTVATVAYQVSGTSTSVRALKTVATDSNGVIYQTTFGANNGLETILPEAAGTFSNDAVESYLETDPGQSSLDANGNVQAVSVDREVNANGTYVQKNGATSDSGAIVNNVATENADYSGTLALASVPGAPGGRLFTFSPPAGTSITYTYFRGDNMTTATSTAPNWIPAQSAPSVETDTITVGSPLDTSCKPSASYPTTANKVQQKLSIIDAVFGTIETRTTTSYDVPGPGSICIVASDTISTFYDYSYQEGGRLTTSPSASVPVESIAISETTSLQSSSVPAASVIRAPQSVGSDALLLPRSVLAAHVVHLARQEAARRLATLHASGGTH